MSFYSWICEGLKNDHSGARGFRDVLEHHYKTHQPNKAKPGLIPMSCAAKELYQQACKGGNQGVVRKNSYSFYTKIPLRYEHRVPLRVIRDLIAASGYDPLRAEEILKDYFQIVWITKEEDKVLKQHGLNSKMPAGWKIGDAPDARYQEAGIKVIS